MHHAPHESCTDEDLGPLTQHRMALPATIWAAGLLFACVTALIDGPVAPVAPDTTTAQPAQHAPAATAPAPGRG